MSISGHPPTSREQAVEQIRKARSIFIAYSHSDIRTVRQLHRRLVKLRKPAPAGSVFLDQENLMPGADVSPAVVDQHLRDSDLLIVACGSRTAESVQVARELELGMRLRSEGRLDILPIVLQASVSLPKQLDYSIQAIFVTTLFPEIARNRLGVVALAVGFLVAIGVMGQARLRAAEARRIAVSRALATQALSQSPDDAELAQLLAVEAWKAAETTEAVSALQTTVQRDPSLIRTLRLQGESAKGLAFSPDGGRLVSAGGDGHLAVWDWSAGKLDGEPFGLPGSRLEWVAHDPVASEIATADGDNIVLIWDLNSRQVIDRVTAGEARISRVEYNPDGTSIAAFGKDGELWIWDRRTRKVLAHFSGNGGMSASLAFSSDGKWLATGGDDGIQIRDTTSFESYSTLSTNGWNFSLAFGDEYRLLASNVDAGSLWNLTAATPTRHGLGDPMAVPAAVGFLPKTAVLVWLVENRVEVRDLAVAAGSRPAHGGHGGRLFKLAVDPKGRVLAAADEDQAIRIWSAEQVPTTGRRLGPVPDPSAGALTTASVSRDGGRFAVAEGGRIQTFDLATGRSLATMQPAGADIIWSIDFSPDGKTLAAGVGSAVYTWNSETGTPTGPPLAARREELRGLSFAPTGGTIMALERQSDLRFSPTSSDSVAIVEWDVATREVRPGRFRSLGEPRLAEQSLDGRFLATAGFDGVQLWDTSSGAPIRGRLSSRGGLPTALAFDASSGLLAGAIDRNLYVWNTGTGELDWEAVVEGGGVDAIAFHPTKPILATGDGSRLNLWDSATGTQLGKPFRDPEEMLIRSVSFIQDGRELLYTTNKGTIWILPVDASVWADVACRRVGRALSRAEWTRFLGDATYAPYCNPSDGSEHATGNGGQR